MSPFPALRIRSLVTGVVATLVVIGAPAAISITTTNTTPVNTAEPLDLDLSASNRRAPVSGLYDWSQAGYRGGANLPGQNEINPSASCQITPAELASQHNVRPTDGADDSAGLQAAIDAIRISCSPSASYTKLSLITLPAGTLNVSRQLGVDADYLVLRGAGSDPATGTRIVFRPDANTRYDALTPDGSDWDEDGMPYGQGKGGWLWPGRGLFRVQSRGVHSSYASDYSSAPANRKDIFEGTVNVHWKSGMKLAAKSGDPGFSARAGDRVVRLASGSLTNFKVGGLVNIRAANSMRFYQQQQALPTPHPLLNMHMRQQLFTITAVDSSARTITLDKPLEYDVPVSSTSDGSSQIGGATYDSKAAPLVDPVLGVGFENLSFTQDIPGLDPANARHNFGNMSPRDQMHGIVFKWAANSWVRGIRAELTGSHPIVTEEAKNLQIVDNQLDGSWNKGKGGNGYFRGSRVWDSLYAGNVSRNLRHFTFQWSASGNVVIGNDFDSDLNLHGGWERNNLFELNTVKVPYAHRPGNCRDNCGDEGGSPPDDSNWFPIWWGAGKKAVKWSGASGQRNVFFNNAMTKQLGNDTNPYTDYYPDRHRIYQFGWSGTAWQHLDAGGTPIADWAHNEQRDYSGGHGVDATRTDPGESLFLKSVNAVSTMDEAVHFRRSSADGVIRDSLIEHTGLVQPQFGEGVYIGSAKSNFTCHGNSGGMDRSDRVQVLNNHIGPFVTAEHLDIKEGTEDGVVRGNTFDGRGIAGQNSADSWVDAKGNNYRIENNAGTFRPPGVFANGYETHNLLTGYGCGNVWRDNKSDLGGEGEYAIKVTSTSKCEGNLNVVFASNTVTNATKGLTNIKVTP